MKLTTTTYIAVGGKHGSFVLNANRVLLSVRQARFLRTSANPRRNIDRLGLLVRE
jgi:hypothetical protein